MNSQAKVGPKTQGKEENTDDLVRDREKKKKNLIKLALMVYSQTTTTPTLIKRRLGYSS